MKIITLMPIKNEEFMLPITLPSLKRISDEIIILDDGSTDNSLKIAEKAGVTVVNTPKESKYEYMSSKRELLLEHGRRRGGTHFVCLDADEILVYSDPKKIREYILNMEPGTKCALPWISLWKSPYYYRNDKSVWANLQKDFIVADTKELGFEKRYFSEARTPGPNNPKTYLSAPEDLARVLHLQFVPWNRFQMKQAWYRCSELIKAPGKHKKINYQYSITLEDKKTKCKKVPKKWLKGIKIPKNLEKLPPAWHKKAIFEYFDKYGIDFFEPLQIWHIPNLRKEFLKRIKREPISKTYSNTAIFGRNMLVKTFNMMPQKLQKTILNLIKK